MSKKHAFSQSHIRSFVKAWFSYLFYAVYNFEGYFLSSQYFTFLNNIHIHIFSAVVNSLYFRSTLCWSNFGFVVKNNTGYVLYRFSSAIIFCTMYIFKHNFYVENMTAEPTVRYVNVSKFLHYVSKKSYFHSQLL